jgi:hypothetical protein
MKPFRETRLFKFLSSKGLDTALNIGGMVVPGLNIVDGIKDMIVSGTAPVEITDSDKNEFFQAYNEYLKELDMILQDVANARNMYVAKNEMADRIARWVMIWNLPVIILLAGVLVACTYYFDSVILALVSATIGGLITSLTSERQALINFFYGSSKGSKDTNEFIRKKLTDGN